MDIFQVWINAARAHTGEYRMRMALGARSGPARQCGPRAARPLGLGRRADHRQHRGEQLALRAGHAGEVAELETGMATRGHPAELAGEALEQGDALVEAALEGLGTDGV